MTICARRLAAHVLAAAAVWTAAAGMASACPDPVYLYLLQNGQPDRYIAFVYRRGEPAAGHVRRLEHLRSSPANLVVVDVDLDASPDGRLVDLFARQPGAQIPWMVVAFPPAYGIAEPLASLPFTDDAVAGLLDSPHRAEIARRIVQGDVGVFLLIETGDRARDDAAASRLGRLVEKMNIDFAFYDPTVEFAQRMGIEYTLQERQGIMSTLDIRYSMLRVPDLSSERLLRDTVRSAWSTVAPLEAAAGPVVALSFARGGLMRAFLPDRAGDAEILANAHDLLMPCSCEFEPAAIMRSMLMTVDWEAVISGSPAIEFAMPPLPPAVLPDSIESPALAASSSLMIWLAALASLAVGAGAAAAVAALLHRRRPAP